ncbi:hypothetical protein L0Y40_00820 [Candidatus Wolfebacteria bacterium]|nr:hypothetical protein [Candidatus Wolfebacteria bacterium]
MRRKLDAHEPTETPQTPQPTVVVADTTFWGRHYGICVFRSPALKHNLWWTEVEKEVMATYHCGRKILEERGWTFTAAVIDGRRGLATVFNDIPVQMCHFHQVQIVRRHLTSRPKTEAGRALLHIAYTLTYANEHTFASRLERWERRWKAYVTEKTQVLGTTHWYYTHKEVRKAYMSIIRNLPYLFTYQKYPKLNIPNTTNSLDGSFAQLKGKLRAHSGLTKERRYKVISEVLKGEI